MTISVVTGVLVTNGHGQFLIVRKPDGIGPYAGAYLTPGGGVGPDEPADTAAVRELYEETGITVTDLARVSFDEGMTANWKGVPTHYIMLLYTAKYVSGDLHATDGDDDHLADMRWVTPDEAAGLPLSPPLARLLVSLGLIGADGMNSR